MDLLLTMMVGVCVLAFFFAVTWAAFESRIFRAMILIVAVIAAAYVWGNIGRKVLADIAHGRGVLVLRALK